jgi:hypothetical protein
MSYSRAGLLTHRPRWTRLEVTQVGSATKDIHISLGNVLTIARSPVRIPFCGCRLYSRATARDRQGVVLQEGNTVGYLTLIGSPLITNLKQLCDVTASRHVQILVTGDAFYRFDKSNTVPATWPRHCS